MEYTVFYKGLRTRGRLFLGVLVNPFFDLEKSLGDDRDDLLDLLEKAFPIDKIEHVLHLFSLEKCEISVTR
jgi:hypothetical protein